MPRLMVEAKPNSKAELHTHTVYIHALICSTSDALRDGIGNWLWSIANSGNSKL